MMRTELITRRVFFHPPQRATQATIACQSGKVHAAAVLDDGRIAAAGDDGWIRVWGPECASASVSAAAVGGGGAVAAGGAAVLEGHKGAVFALCALRAGGVASGGQDKAVRIWEPSGRGFAGCALEPSHAGVVRTVATLSADCLASGSDDRTVRIWCADEESERTHARFLPTDTAWSQSRRSVQCAFSCSCTSASADRHLTAPPSPARLRSLNHDRRSLETRKCRHVLRGHKAEVLSAAGVAGGLLATGGAEGQVRLWDWSSGQSVAVLTGASPSPPAFLPATAGFGVRGNVS